LEIIKINLATFEYQDKCLSYPVMLIVAAVVLIISGLSLSTGFNAQTEIKDYERRIAEREQGVLKRQQIKKIPRLKDGDIESLKKDINLINGLINLDAYPYDRLLGSLELCVPSGIVLSSFEMSKDFSKATLKGNAASMNDITVFLNNLNNSNIYKTNNLINLSVSQADETKEESAFMGSGITFDIESSIARDRIWEKE
jgi:Tfp pilus assembly protein PilN